MKQNVLRDPILTLITHHIIVNKHNSIYQSVILLIDKNILP